MLFRHHNTIVHLHSDSDLAMSQPIEMMCDIANHRKHLVHSLDKLRHSAESLEAAAALLIQTFERGGKVLIAGNGGSAAEAQHFAGELVGRFRRERAPYAALALTADTATLTALGNDYGYSEIFARQVAAYGQPGDVLIAISTSGESNNLVRAAGEARSRKMHVITMTGERLSSLSARATIAILAPADETPTIQELHMVIVHLLADVVERTLATSPVPTEAIG